MSNNQWSILRGSTYGKMYTLYFDGSHNNQDKKAGAGCVIMDSQGEFVVAAAYNLTQTYREYCDVAIVEAAALCIGLKLAKDRNLNLNLIKGDSTEVIDRVLDRSRRPSRPPLSRIIQQIIGLIDGQNIVIIRREANRVADKLAYWGCSRLEEGGREFYTTYFDLPPQVAELIRQEKSFSNIREEEDDGEGSSSLAENIGMAGSAVAGVAMLAWGMYKLVSGESSSDKDEHKNKAKAPQPREFIRTLDYASNNMSLNDDYYTLHYSGSDINQHQNGGAGCIIRNRYGKLIISATYNLNHLYPVQYNIAVAEAIAWSKGLKLAETKRLKLFRIIGDNKEVIDRVRGQEKKAPKVPLLSEIVGEIREALEKHSISPWNQVALIGRDENKVANELASLGSKLGCLGEKSYGSDNVLPFKLDQLIREDEVNIRGKNLLM
ncbi:uncharacterized protein LOC110721557 [Chenopodium quinoa]|nr:uncharacterized protein LOC110721528 [Chenopodium quinoa]XP_021756427.1 uncharacterized protein LOC110721557 [Chenopodium quinoa]